MFENELQQTVFERLIAGGLPEVYAVMAARQADGYDPDEESALHVLSGAFLWAYSAEGSDFWRGVRADWRHHLQHMEWI